jgi:hypothetical protein
MAPDEAKLTPWILNDGTKGFCKRCEGEARITAVFSFETFVSEHMSCKGEENATYQVIRQRYGDGPDGFTSIEEHYVVGRGLTRGDAERLVDLFQEQHKRNADLSFFLLPE